MDAYEDTAKFTKAASLSKYASPSRTLPRKQLTLLCKETKWRTVLSTGGCFLETVMNMFSGSSCHNGHAGNRNGGGKKSLKDSEWAISGFGITY
jgi:hypothetical protein